MRIAKLIRGVAMVAAVIGLSAVSVQAAELADFSRVYPDDLHVTGFKLDGKQEVRITSLGFGYRSSGTTLVLTNAWIMRASDREVVWEMADSREEWKEKRVTEETYLVELPAGEYEVYYSTYPQYHHRNWSLGKMGWSGFLDRGLDRVHDKLLDNEDLDDIEDLYRTLSVKIEGNGTRLSAEDVEKIHDDTVKDAILSIRKTRDHEYFEKGFALDKPMKIRIYAVGEANKDGAYDYGYIMNVDTRKKVWRFNYGDSYHAGGAKKNRMIDDVFEAPAGKYVAVIVSDGSHSWNRWNSAPPFDPDFWGMTIFAEDAGDRRHAKLYDYEEQAMKDVVVSLTKVGDDEYLKKGFSLKKPMDLRVYALGEGRDGDMYDYGWIVNATTHERVWTMDLRDTEHAGGGEKNRVVDEVVHFEKGDYIAYYATDGSHSYPHWNTTAPLDRKHWGLTIAGANGFDAKNVAEYDDEGSGQGQHLVRIGEVRDDEYVSKEFTLDKEMVVHVYALGEGRNGQMYDYGWIENEATGKVVWEMTYRRTSHAGGASKNRMISETVTLKAGKYRVFYETDDSHSYGDWNASHPHEPSYWGIAINVPKK